MTFHRPRDEIHPSSAENAREMKNCEPDGGVTVKEEVMQGGKEEEEEEEEEVNVDDQIGQEEHEEAKREEQKLKTEVDIETSNKMES